MLATKVAPTAARPNCRRAARTTAILAGGCAVLHTLLVAIAGGKMWAATVPMLAMSLVCAACGKRLWRDPARRDAVAMVASAALMAALHIVLMRSLEMTSPMHDSMSGGASGWLMKLASLLVVTQLVLAGAVASALARPRSDKAVRAPASREDS